MSESIYSSPALDVYLIDEIKGGECYLVLAKDPLLGQSRSIPESTEPAAAAPKAKALLFDSGYAFGAQLQVAAVEKLLDGRTLDYIFLSHSHYDHASGSVWFKRRWPEAERLATAHAAQVFTRPGARKVIRGLNAQVAQEYGWAWPDPAEESEQRELALLEELAVDKIVGTGSVINLGCTRFEVFDAPGHTKDTAMLFSTEESLLLGCESLGVYAGPDLVIPCFLTSYYDSLESIATAQRCKPEHLLLSHHGIIHGDDVACFLANSDRWTREAGRLILEDAANGLDVSQTAAHLKTVFYPSAVHQFYPEPAFDLNNRLMIELMLREDGA